jgi:hypothetical protein
MSDQSGFWSQAWRRMQAESLAWIVDLWRYILLWVGLLVGHAIRLLMAWVGIEQWFVGSIGWLEKVTFFASFCHFFICILLRLRKAGLK